MILIFGAVLGFISIAFGAYAEHGLKASITPEHFHFIMTAIRYNQLYAIVVSGIGLALLGSDKLAQSLSLKISGLLFTLGTLLFSFSIYFAVILDIPQLVRLAPIGGSTLMLGWIILAIAGLLTLKYKNL
ncbi:DUF423 domain-containing protein [Allofrancisella guangzhouensis]|uniref:DUF423 domain-containing protein n=1 Tax=Allofrancisella guangzhouensis TaxID=594679 RepID=A0A0A8E2L6_9GAMM|nr:DUF423 domain-containing protein [Allofrancisella guangzhouensis]AJC48184.1 hypothetical protein SD28_00150 [Allofrancisella guangzhouensis]MBK2027050.1 DUF423 domain-containing protein [Allofrancisella guangzhouensis]MBK2044540.1 DUF423 domain-containing protein [Allofrancisella guangzhouensis]MBK2046128.1 DUF423 domain-containing protein [Allofrancisella guangzhouensis]